MIRYLIDEALELWQTLFGCLHWDYTRVFTDPRTKRSHVACLRCGAELEYDLAEMRVVRPCSRVRPADTLEEV
jgi:hypothetical protein